MHTEFWCGSLLEDREGDEMVTLRWILGRFVGRGGLRMELAQDCGNGGLVVLSIRFLHPQH